ncbi:uncharacterized protein TRIVIDRAFT_132867, partial [Trichoderma virens Gv29-8]
TLTNGKTVHCRDKLLLTDPLTHRETLKMEKGRRAPGTCEWIRENEAYKSWLDGDEKCLWIHGGPGKGKTMLSIFLTEELESKEITLLFFFCINGDKNRNNAISVLRGLVYQLLTKHLNLLKYISSYFETEKIAENTLSSPVALWSMFKTLLQSPELGAVFCVLDGLDECDENSLENLSRQFRDFYFPSDHKRHIAQNLKLAIVSRKINGLQGFRQIRLDPDNNNCINEDIKQFISASVQELSRLPGFNDGFRKNIEKTLLSRSEGTFLWIGFVMCELLRCITCTEVTGVLNVLPSGLPAMYGRMLKQIKSSQRRLLSSILICVTMALRPMKLEELKTAVSLLSDTSISSNHVMRDHIISCGPILQTYDGQVSLVHQSARDYLLREDVDDDPILEEFRIKAEEAHANLAKICLDYIEKSDFRHQSLNIGDPDASILQKWPLLQYAAMYWPEHARRSLYADEDAILSRPFFQNECTVRDQWWQRVINQKDEDGVTALEWAAGNGHKAVVQTLLANGADVNEPDEYGCRSNALDSAAGRGYEAIVQLLLANGANANTRDHHGDTVLILATEFDHEAVVRLLITYGADVNTDNNWGGETALIMAARRGSEAVVQLLLANGADANIPDRGGYTALSKAAGCNKEAIVQLLLTHGADVNTKDKHGYTALRNAAYKGHEAVVKRLLTHGADVNIKDKHGYTALSSAAGNGHEAVVRLLLAHGA